MTKEDDKELYDDIDYLDRQSSIECIYAYANDAKSTDSQEHLFNVIEQIKVHCMEYL